VLAYTPLLMLLPRYFTHKKWLHYGPGILVFLVAPISGRMLENHLLFHQYLPGRQQIKIEIHVHEIPIGKLYKVSLMEKIEKR
jgi:hypothetical protein